MGNFLSGCWFPDPRSVVTVTPSSAAGGGGFGFGSGAGGQGFGGAGGASGGLAISASASASVETALASVPLTPPVEETYELGRRLGAGSFGRVLAARARSRSGSEASGEEPPEVAVKLLDLSRIKASSVLREWTVLQHIAAAAAAPAGTVAPAPGPSCFEVAGIVAFHGTVRAPGEVAFVFELMHGGELFSLLVGRGAIPEPLVRRSIRPVIEALAFLHKHGVVHRDIKPENLLLKAPVPDSTPLADVGDLQLKIADFGLAQVIAADGTQRLVKSCGTWAYSAPEMNAPSRPGYGAPYDMCEATSATY